MKKYYCSDCGDEIGYNSANYGQGRCRSCETKRRHKLGILDSKLSNYIDGRCSKVYYCKELYCNNKITIITAIYGSGLCRSCSQKGTKNSFSGKHHTEEIKNKIRNSDYHKNLKGKKAPNWKGGTSFEPYPSMFNKVLKDKIRQRDNYICQICGKLEKELAKNYHKKLSIHHIDYDKNNLNLENLISLCVSCHHKTNGNRDYWYAYFTYLMEELR